MFFPSKHPSCISAFSLAVYMSSLRSALPVLFYHQVLYALCSAWFQSCFSDLACVFLCVPAPVNYVTCVLNPPVSLSSWSCHKQSCYVSPLCLPCVSPVSRLCPFCPSSSFSGYFNTRFLILFLLYLKLGSYSVCGS